MSQIAEDAKKFANILVELSPILTKVSNEVTYDNTKGYGLKLSGFYNDGQITVWPAQGDGKMGQELYTIEGRRNEQLSEIYPGDNLLDEVIRLNAERFRHWNCVNPDTVVDAAWLPILLEHELVQPVVTTTYTVR